MVVLGCCDRRASAKAREGAEVDDGEREGAFGKVDEKEAVNGKPLPEHQIEDRDWRIFQICDLPMVRILVVFRLCWC